MTSQTPPSRRLPRKLLSQRPLGSTSLIREPIHTETDWHRGFVHGLAVSAVHYARRMGLETTHPRDAISELHSRQAAFASLSAQHDLSAAVPTQGGVQGTWPPSLGGGPPGGTMEEWRSQWHMMRPKATVGGAGYMTAPQPMSHLGVARPRAALGRPRQGMNTLFRVTSGEETTLQVLENELWSPIERPRSGSSSGEESSHREDLSPSMFMRDERPISRGSMGAEIPEPLSEDYAMSHFKDVPRPNSRESAGTPYVAQHFPRRNSAGTERTGAGMTRRGSVSSVRTGAQRASASSRRGSVSVLHYSPVDHVNVLVDMNAREVRPYETLPAEAPTLYVSASSTAKATTARKRRGSVGDAYGAARGGKRGWAYREDGLSNAHLRH